MATSHIGFVASGFPTFQEPFNHVCRFKPLDVFSESRSGWNCRHRSYPAVAANYGKPVAESSERYQRDHESFQTVQALWGRWQREAHIKDAARLYMCPEVLDELSHDGDELQRWPSNMTTSFPGLRARRFQCWWLTPRPKLVVTNAEKAGPGPIDKNKRYRKQRSQLVLDQKYLWPCSSISVVIQLAPLVLVLTSLRSPAGQPM